MFIGVYSCVMRLNGADYDEFSGGIFSTMVLILLKIVLKLLFREQISSSIQPPYNNLSDQCIRLALETPA